MRQRPHGREASDLEGDAPDEQIGEMKRRAVVRRKTPRPSSPFARLAPVGMPPRERPGESAQGMLSGIEPTRLAARGTARHQGRWCLRARVAPTCTATVAFDMSLNVPIGGDIGRPDGGVPVVVDAPGGPT